MSAWGDVRGAKRRAAMRQDVTRADQVVLLTRNGEEWTWRDGKTEVGGFRSAHDALDDYLSRPFVPPGQGKLL